MFGFGLASATLSLVLERFRLYLRFFGLLDFYTLPLGEKAGKFSSWFKELDIDLDVSRLHLEVVLLSNTEESRRIGQ